MAQLSSSIPLEKDVVYGLTFIAQQKLILDPIDRHRLRLQVIRSPPHELQAFISRIEEPLRVQRLRIDDLEPINARYTKLRLEEVYRA